MAAPQKGMKKRCANCKRKLLLGEFWKHYKSPDGLQYKCKDCAKIYKKTPARRKAQRAYTQTEKFKSSLTKHRNTEKYRHTHNKQQANRNRINPDIRRNSILKRRYDITLKEYDKMFETQNGVCGLPEMMRRLCVDHDHKTGEVRALLCDRCNRFLGAASDDINLLMKGIEYLNQERKQKCRPASILV